MVTASILRLRDGASSLSVLDELREISISLEGNFFMVNVVVKCSPLSCVTSESVYFLLYHSYLEFSNSQQSLETDTDDLIRVSMA